MYLKSIEVHGFKSFANKIMFKFNDGITAIVGPNGSGKSNVADAVRWVLGEQSAKQLRGIKMEDVIFSGTEIRKPMGYAYVAITLDNSDHQLPIEYEEVVVARRVYRSGESEYLLNGNPCRLRDVLDLMLDTGIGKEGYSIIGQGQIDKILSSKPEDRRELFDEAAGIVKFKKRKATAEAELEQEKQNLERINDILSEIESQVGPLEKQSEIAKEYLALKEKLKKNEINLFLDDYERNEEQKTDLDRKIKIATEDLADSKAKYESTKTEYETLEKQQEDCENEIEKSKEQRNALLMQAQKHESEIAVMNERITSMLQSDAFFGSRKETVSKDKEEKLSELETYQKSYEINKAKYDELELKKKDSQAEIEKIREEINADSKTIEECNRILHDIMDQEFRIKTKLQHFETVKETNTKRRLELANAIIGQRADENASLEKLEECQKEYDEVSKQIADLQSELTYVDEKEVSHKQELSTLSTEIERMQKTHIEEKTKLSTLKNITERYEGYNIAIKKVMECKDRNKGIIGVVADIIKVAQEYEIAIETALGASIQNIVTKDEDTAKKMIEMLKDNHYGRATFLPLSSITVKSLEQIGQVRGERGVIGNASVLVDVDPEYNELVNFLLGRTIVVDKIDNALAIARKYHYTLRIVTLEGEQLNPGGSLSGGSYKNNNNLLGRKREVEEAEEKLEQLVSQLNAKVEYRDRIRKEREELKEEHSRLKEKIQSSLLKQNTAKINLSRETERYQEKKSLADSTDEMLKEIDRVKDENLKEYEQLSDQLKNNEEIKLQADETSEECSMRLEENRRKEQYANEKVMGISTETANAFQSVHFDEENISRVKGELAKIEDEILSITNDFGNNKEKIEEQQQTIEQLKTDINAEKNSADDLEKKIEELNITRMKIVNDNRNFFKIREELSERITNLDKEVFRINSQDEKIKEYMNTQADYIWNEYNLTLEGAKEYKDDEPVSYSTLKKRIFDIKVDIRNLGDVNVNAIEEYKKVSERYQLYSTQHEDIVKAEEELRNIIVQLDDEMRKQFESKFGEIRRQFDGVFKELFGGGKGTLELVEDEDILEAGIMINAQPPGKKLQNMMQLSGGEKALTAIALLFAIQNLKPSPFCLLDEIEAALDDSNVDRYAKYLHKLTKHTQFIVITHRRGTMASADALYGITMQEKGVSALVSVSLIEDKLD